MPMEFGIAEMLTVVVILFLGLYYYLTSNFDFWRKLNIKGPKPLPVFGNLVDNLLGKSHFALLIKKYYDEYKSEAMVGIFIGRKPVLILRNPDHIKDILIKDFNKFPDRDLFTPSKDDPVNQNLLTLEYKRWRPLRNLLTPVFTSGKIKAMLYLILECANQLEEYVEKLAEKDVPIECRELSAKYTTDAIGICAFGLNANSFQDVDSGFREAGRSMMSTSLTNIMSRLLRTWLPRIHTLLRCVIRNRAVDFFVNSMNETIAYRRKTNIRRNDFIDLLIDLKDNPGKLDGFEFTDYILTSQAFIFFIAGFETSSTTMSNVLYELALHQDYQDRLRKEIKKVIKEEGQLSYQNIKNMKYLDMVFKEVLRKYPPGAVLQRRSIVPYTFKDTNITIPKYMKIIIPVWAIHNDPDIYLNPEEFDPERFNEENIKLRHSMHFLPFGDGPRNCMGLRFGVYQTKIGIATLIAKFRMDICNKTLTTYRIDPRAPIPAPIGGIYLQITKL